MNPAGPRDLPAPDDLDAWLSRLEGAADASAGERVFYHPEGPGCYRCHQVEGRGGRVGPDLSTTGQVLTRRRLVESILRPSLEIAPQFVAWQVARDDGTVFSGTLLSESADGLQTYADSEGKLIQVHSSEVADRRPLSTSIMPEELPRTMTLREFRDLLAYLQGRR